MVLENSKNKTSQFVKDFAEQFELRPELLVHYEKRNLIILVITFFHKRPFTACKELY